MKKIITGFVIFLFLTSCGFTPIYSTKNFDFRLKKIVSKENNQLNSKIEKQLQVFSNQESQKIMSLEVDGQRLVNTLTKDSKGNPSRHEMIINIKLEITYLQKKITKSFEEKFNYNVGKNKFELNQYEKEIENLLINRNIDLIIVYLSKL